MNRPSPEFKASSPTPAAPMASVRQDKVAQNTPMVGGEIDLGLLLHTLWRGKVWILLCGLVAFTLGVIYAYSIAVPEYTASSTVAFESREEQVVDLEGVVGGLGGDQATINTEVEVLRSRGLMEKLVLKLDLVSNPEFNARLRPIPTLSVEGIKGLIFGNTPPDPLTERAELDAVIDVLLSKISVSNIRQSYVFRLTATTQNRQMSADISNALADAYILDQLEVKFSATEQATEWLTSRVGDLQHELETSVAAVKEFSSTSQLISPEALGGLNRQVKELRDRQRDTQNAATEAQARLKTLEAARESGDLQRMAIVANDSTLNRTLQLMQNGAVTDDTAFMTRFNQITTRAEFEYDRLEIQVQTMGRSIAELDAQVNEQSGDLVTLQQLEREAEASRLIYEFFLNRLKETSVQQGIQQADSRVLSRAVVPTTASAPRKSIIMVMSLMLGLMVGSGGVLARELTQNTIRNADELEGLTGQPVLGQIPVIPARQRLNVLNYLTEKPTSAAAEAIRNLRTSTLLSNVDTPPQIIMSTSSIPSEGKTTQSLALAQNLSGLGKRVLLIEGDIRRRVFAEYFDIKGQIGLLAVLGDHAELEDAVVYNDQLRADILVGEKASANAADIFSSDAFRALLDDARQIYDYIVIDTPPVLIVPDARIIGQMVDAILYTVRWDHTTKRQVVEGLKSFENVNLRITGLVLGQINAKGMKKYGYGDSYGAYGAYGAGYYDN